MRNWFAICRRRIIIKAHERQRGREREEKNQITQMSKSKQLKISIYGTLIHSPLRVSRCSYSQSPADVIKTATKEQLSKKVVMDQ